MRHSTPSDLGMPTRTHFGDEPDDDAGIDLREALRPALQHWRIVLASTIVCGALGAGGSFLVPPLYESHTVFVPPQQQGNASSALASLGGLAALAGLGGASKNSVDQYVSLMKSETAMNRIVDRFDLMKVYDQELREKTLKKLTRRTSIVAGKKDGLVTVSVEDTDPKRAAAMANQYVEELRHLTSTLAVSEAQQRRAFFETQMQEAKAKLIAAQTALQSSGFDRGALNAAPATASTGYVRLRGELAAATVKLETLRNSLADTAPEVRQQSAMVGALQEQLRDMEATETQGSNSPDYVSKYREFRYEETIFDLMAKQYELARVDEAREGALVQVVDPAHEAERKSWPIRSLFLAGGALVGLLGAVIVLATRARKAAA